MSFLTGDEIIKRVGDGSIVIDPFDEARVGPNSYDLSLGPTILVYEKNVARHFAMEAGKCLAQWCEPLDMAVEERTVGFIIPPGGMVLWPGVLYLGHTAEITETYGLVPCIEGRSSVGRLGLTTHVTAGVGETGFSGTWTLEMVATVPVRVYPGVRICQVLYTTTTGKVRPYAGKYQGQRMPRASRLWTELTVP